jgi:fructosamine-3-kinase
MGTQVSHAAGGSPAERIGAVVAVQLGEPVRSATPLSGGDLCKAWRVELASGTVFAKSMDDAPPGTLAVEAAGLDWLRAAGALDVPEVLAVDDRALVLVWVDEGLRTPVADERLGRGLAALHGSGADAFGATPPGGGAAGFLARLGVGAQPSLTWAEHLTTRRWAPLAAEAERRGALPPGARDAVEHLAGRLRDAATGLAGPPEPPARLHGDLWAGNVLWSVGDRPWLIDPAAHGGHRETDLAMMRLFGGFGPATFAAYDEVNPLAEGWQERVALHQLDPLLVHACLFGGGYGTRVAEIAARYR